MGNIQCHDASEGDVPAPLGGKVPPGGVTSSAASCRSRMDAARCREAAARRELTDARIRVMSIEARVEAQKLRVEQAQRRKRRADSRMDRAVHRRELGRRGRVVDAWLDLSRRSLGDAQALLEKETQLLRQETAELEQAKAPVTELGDELERRRSAVKEMQAVAEAFQVQVSNSGRSSSKTAQDCMMTQLVSHFDSITEHYKVVPIPSEISVPPVLSASDSTISDIGDEEADQDLDLLANLSWNKDTSEDSSTGSPTMSHPDERDASYLLAAH